MRLSPPFPFSFSGITSRRSIHSRLFASNAAAGPAPPSHRPPYFVPRNSRGSLPIYPDIRNGGSRYLISVRNVEGNIKALADDLLRDLSDPKSPLVKARITRSKHLVLSGLRQKHAVLDWFIRHGF
ncbi:hypothetical protein BC826DRAFT_909067 [Russula brevipes]|nr:hypothetical protein BC826DRAFT_909067 [Russula brevipes]